MLVPPWGGVYPSDGPRRFPMNIHIAAFPKCWIEEICSGRMDLQEWISLSTQLGCEGLELYVGFLRSLDAPYLRSVRKSVEKLGMQIPMICYSPDFTVPEEDLRRKEVEKQAAAIRASAELGAGFCRTLSGQRRPDVSVADGIDWVVDCIEQCLPVAESSGVCLVIENHYKDGFWKYPEFAQKREIFLEILNRIDSPSLGIQYDPSNALVAGDDPIALLDLVLARVRTVHASDRYLKPGASLAALSKSEGTAGYTSELLHGVTGKGLNDYDKILGRLARVDFEGWISIEDGMRGMDEMKESVEFLKRMRSIYQDA
jgi:sugar phosphate isomerase/epimerase